MHITLHNVLSHVSGMTKEEQVLWPELYSLFTFDIPNADRAYAVQLKKLCVELIGKDIHSVEHLETETKSLIKKNRWHDKLWEWYVEKAMESLPIPNQLHIRNRLSRLARVKGKDPKISLLSAANGHSFPTGLLTLVVEFAIKHKLKIKISDQRGITYPFVHKPNLLQLRPYQSACVNLAITNTILSTTWQRGIIQVPTGGGKTEIAIALTQLHDGVTLFLVNRKELLHQTYDRFSRAMPGVDIAAIGDGIVKYNGSEKVIVASVQTLWSMSKGEILNLEKLRRSVTQLFIDEAHGVAASEDTTNTMVKISEFFNLTPIRWGLTATPLMRDNLSNALLTGVTGNVVFKMTSDDLIKLGYLTRPKVILTTVNHKSSYEDPITKEELSRPPGTRWKELYDFAIVKNPFRNKAIADILRTIPTPAIVLVQRLDHIHYINHYSPFNIQFLRGTSTEEERELAKRRLKSGEIKVLGATTIFDEGVDIPELKAIVLAGGGKSNIKTMQRLGRGLRLAEGKTEVLIYDFVDMNTSCPGWIPMKHSKERMSVYKKEGFEIDTR